MADGVESLLEKFSLEISIEQRKHLSFLYEKLHVDELSDKEQYLFIDYFYKNETLQQIAAFALELVDVTYEICRNMPTIKQIEQLANRKEQRLYYEQKGQNVRRQRLKQRMHRNGNVLYVPFGDYKEGQGPIVICLEQTIGMTKYSAFCKSVILSFFMDAHQEQRDLYIVPYDCQIHVHYRFESGQLNLVDFKNFIDHKTKGEAAILPVLQFVKGLLQENQQCADTDVIIFTEGNPIDGQHLLGQRAKIMLEELKQRYNAEFSVVALNEQHFNAHYFWFADKAIFTGDAIP